jgi:hypothetical protein
LRVDGAVETALHVDERRAARVGQAGTARTGRHGARAVRAAITGGG